MAIVNPYLWCTWHLHIAKKLDLDSLWDLNTFSKKTNQFLEKNLSQK